MGIRGGRRTRHTVRRPPPGCPLPATPAAPPRTQSTGAHSGTSGQSSAHARGRRPPRETKRSTLPRLEWRGQTTPTATQRSSLPSQSLQPRTALSKADAAAQPAHPTRNQISELCPSSGHLVALALIQYDEESLNELRRQPDVSPAHWPPREEDDKRRTIPCATAAEITMSDLPCIKVVAALPLTSPAMKKDAADETSTAVQHDI